MHSFQPATAQKGTIYTTIPPVQNAFSEIWHCRTEEEVFTIKNIKQVSGLCPDLKFQMPFFFNFISKDHDQRYTAFLIQINTKYTRFFFPD